MLKFFESLDWANWFYGLVAGAVTGGASAIATGFVAGAVDQHFSFGGGNSFKLMGGMFLFNALKDAALYLKQNPLPQKCVAASAGKNS